VHERNANTAILAEVGMELNKKLSERRAAMIKQYLVENFHISPGNLRTIGYGKTRLKNPSDLKASEAATSGSDWCSNRCRPATARSSAAYRGTAIAIETLGKVGPQQWNAGAGLQAAPDPASGRGSVLSS
jgi:hypothetical protein